MPHQSSTAVCQHCGRTFTIKYHGNPNIYCSRACLDAAHADLNRPLAERFWSRVDRSGGPDACWPWTLSVRDRGYGYFKSEVGRNLAHRFAYELAHGPIPEGLDVLHHCGVRGCCNPAHLWVDTRPDNERFWSNVDRSGGPESCWLWTAGRFKTGYGQYHSRTGSPNNYTHRYAWELTHGPIPEGMFVCHNCPGGDNRACCNPAHMFIGSSRDNVRDMMAKGKWHHPPFTDPNQRGENHSHAKLTVADVAEIRRRYVRGLHGQTKRLAEEYGVTKETIRRHTRGRGPSWFDE